MTAQAGAQMGMPAGILRNLLRYRQSADQGQRPAAAGGVTRIEDAAGNLAARAANETAGLSVEAGPVLAETCSLAELTEHMPDQSLIAMIEAEGDRLGVIALSFDLVNALIEMQVFGRIGRLPTEKRRPTRADAAIASHFINHLLAGLGAEAMRIGAEDGLIGFRYASHLEDARPVGLMLEDRRFRLLRFSLGIGGTPHAPDSVFLAIPGISDPNQGPDLPQITGAPTASMTAASSGPETAIHRRTLAAPLRQAPIPLTAILCRRRITLAELRTLQPDSVLSIPRHVLSEVRLEAANGHLLASGRLGEAEGFHALRLSGKMMADREDKPDRPMHEPPMADLSAADDFRPDPPIPQEGETVPADGFPAGGNAG